MSAFPTPLLLLPLLLLNETRNDCQDSNRRRRVAAGLAPVAKSYLHPLSLFSVFFVHFRLCSIFWPVLAKPPTLPFYSLILIVESKIQTSWNLNPAAVSILLVRLFFLLEITVHRPLPPPYPTYLNYSRRKRKMQNGNKNHPPIRSNPTHHHHHQSIPVPNFDRAWLSVFFSSLFFYR